MKNCLDCSNELKSKAVRCKSCSLKHYYNLNPGIKKGKIQKPKSPQCPKLTQFSRICPKCQINLYYTSKQGLNNAIKSNKPCKSCSIKQVHKDNPGRNSGENNGRYGLSLFDLWRSTLPKDEAELKIKSWRAQQSENRQGSKNYFYGKIMDLSGRSYKGHYKNVFFRSSLELAFLLQFEEDHGYLLESAENKFRFQIDENHTYTPDFVDYSKKTIYEIKTNFHMNDETNKLKFKIGYKESWKLGFEYQIISEDGIKNYNRKPRKWLLSLHNNKIITLIPSSLEKCRK